MDLLTRLGPLAFASRLKRLAEKLQKDVSLIYERRQIEFKARWFPVMYALSGGKAMSITELAGELNLTHPAINQISNAMMRKGLLVSRKGHKDERQRFISLSAKGKALCRELTPLWQEIKNATDELIQSVDGDFLGSIEQMENSLNTESMYHRVISRLRKLDYDGVEIVDYKPSYKKHFKELNLVWLKKYFTVEKHDIDMLDDPSRKIIKPGGIILFARLDKRIVGTVALQKVTSQTYELCKLAVAEEYRDRQAGLKLIKYAIEKARGLGATEVVLCTSVKLTVANNLYHKLGFRQVDDEYGLSNGFKRKTICMKLNI